MGSVDLRLWRCIRELGQFDCTLDISFVWNMVLVVGRITEIGRDMYKYAPSNLAFKKVALSLM